ncbi:transcriptional repressor [Actibacterium sp. 188UL27-1]|uniref:transcriptional repressor n=1 Tax=Actibacterium sp. 188UL27-1 TaxID=2786961 RepID=UPI00195F23DB|nr:transcriptional repressor [Actibacterium sp. 188UL27-1]MBM7068769.1 transcriptional repressor [Actibacterium sp. 188UL27-1]
MTTSPDPVGFDAHDHASCISDAMETAARYCDRHGLHFTPTRRRVLELLLTRHRALGAYDLLEKLREEGLGSQPPVAYRALDFLVTHGFVHKIEHLNAYVACSHPGEEHAPAFMICRTCDAVVETPARPTTGALGSAARKIGFQIETTVMEASGTCPSCRPDATG